jgi:hypothetical protein
MGLLANRIIPHEAVIRKIRTQWQFSYWAAVQIFTVTAKCDNIQEVIFSLGFLYSAIKRLAFLLHIREIPD